MAIRFFLFSFTVHCEDFTVLLITNKTCFSAQEVVSVLQKILDHAFSCAYIHVELCMKTLETSQEASRRELFLPVSENSYAFLMLPKLSTCISSADVLIEEI